VASIAMSKPAGDKVQVGAAELRQAHVEGHLRYTGSRPWDLRDAVVARPLVDDGTHQCSSIEATAARWLRM
jgi:hypothetical protein